MGLNAKSFKKGEKKQNQGKRGPGKVPKSVKAAIEAAFMDAQADPKSAVNLYNFREHSPREFIAAAAKLIPQDVKATLDAKLLVTPNINLIVEAMNGKIHVETDPAGVNGRKPD